MALTKGLSNEPEPEPEKGDFAGLNEGEILVLMELGQDKLHEIKNAGFSAYIKPDLRNVIEKLRAEIQRRDEAGDAN